MLNIAIAGDADEDEGELEDTPRATSLNPDEEGAGAHESGELLSRSVSALASAQYWERLLKARWEQLQREDEEVRGQKIVFLYVAVLIMTMYGSASLLRNWPRCQCP